MGWVAGKVMNLLDREDVPDNRSEMSIAMDNWLVVESSVVLTISLPGQARLGGWIFFFFFPHAPAYLWKGIL